MSSYRLAARPNGLRPNALSQYVHLDSLPDLVAANVDPQIVTVKDLQGRVIVGLAGLHMTSRNVGAATRCQRGGIA